MTIMDHDYSRRVGYALSLSESRPKLLQIYACLCVLAVAIGAGLGLAF